ncbi:hypothetical protein C1H76_4145 [Elsinoe australis]|uniref:Uncharacterized protein n=1 Tax=Elsinoe australis TaxID=40998 RepID=A0A2P8AK35_9PEZI|nr:hypothetical protein B9Z65_980 [Elsinoe australis]TKX23632.1 hypothetical protein C1H76_4145 [Elsinoe australis]
MAGCLPELKRIFNPNKQRPYLPVDSPYTPGPRPSTSDSRGRSDNPRSISRASSTREFGRKASSRRSSISKTTVPPRQRSRSRSRARSQSPTRTKNDNASSKQNGESRPTGLFAGVKPPLSENATLRQTAPGTDQHIPRMVSARDLKGMGMERVRHHPIRVEQMGREQPRMVRFVDANSETGQTWPQNVQAPQQVHLKPRKASREHLSKQAKAAEKPTGIRQAAKHVPKSLQHSQSQQTFVVELPGEFTDVMEKEAVVVGPTVRQVASYDTFELPSRLATPVPQSATPAHGQAGLAPVMELPGSTIPPSPIDSVAFTAELPGSAPMVAEKDAGPLPPSELPGSVPYQAELAKRMANATFCAAR